MKPNQITEVRVLILGHASRADLHDLLTTAVGLSILTGPCRGRDGTSYGLKG